MLIVDLTSNYPARMDHPFAFMLRTALTPYEIGATIGDATVGYAAGARERCGSLIIHLCSLP